MGYLKHYFTYVEQSKLSAIIEQGLPVDTRLYSPDDLVTAVIYRDTLTNKLKILRGLVCLRLRMTEDYVREVAGKMFLSKPTTSFVQFYPLGLRYDTVTNNGAYELEQAIWNALRDHGSTHFELQVIQETLETSHVTSYVVMVADGRKYDIQVYHYGESRSDLLRDYLAEAQQIVAKIPFITVSAKEE